MDLEPLTLSQGLDLQATASINFLALSPQSWPFGLEWLPASAYLVGGSVRDALLGRRSDYLDLDFVLTDRVVETAQAIARHYKAGFVLLDAERQIARVVFPQGTADFAQQVGATLEEDLRRRDFTVNAIAYDPRLDRFVDPLQGYGDLQQRSLRMVSAENLEEDPLRLLRAYRQAAQLGFSLEAETRAAVKQFAPLLRRIAAERVQSELNYLLSTAKGTPWLTQAWQDGLLQDWLPNATAQSLKCVAEIDRVTVLLQEILPEFARELYGQVRLVSSGHLPTESSPFKASGSARNWLIAAKLACLLSAKTAEAETQLRQLKYSRTEIQAISTVLKFLPQLYPANSVETNQAVTTLASRLNLSRREQYFFFQGVGTTFPAIAVLAIAQGLTIEAISPLIERFLDPSDPVAHSIPVLTGQDLMTALKLPPGPLIGQLLAAIQLAKAEGSLSTAADALSLAADLLAQQKTEM
ncbi:CCA tRNA nucleotidyltransferase [Leptolyngbya sp. Cla-17]|uniref:CCA tRNA nucleotidyltransferase n=1 Tax=Leptolyngbya sp. Cla-17 TaxID=2803751 RepID=UPI001F5D074D|nr:CCA tRNA nucleotidyltransferase [Leptolyngbya sp. Cla-17]